MCQVGAVDCTAHRNTCAELKVEGYPTIKVFGANKRQPEDYNGDRSASGIVDHALRVRDSRRLVLRDNAAAAAITCCAH